jgi:hypothetical protein
MSIWDTIKNHKKKVIAAAIMAPVLIWGIRGTCRGAAIGTWEAMKYLWKGGVGTYEDANAPKYLRFGEGAEEVSLRVPCEYVDQLTQLLNAYKGPDSGIYDAIRAADIKDGRQDGIADANGVESLVLSLSAEKGKRRFSFGDK